MSSRAATPGKFLPSPPPIMPLFPAAVVSATAFNKAFGFLFANTSYQIHTKTHTPAGPFFPMTVADWRTNVLVAKEGHAGGSAIHAFLFNHPEMPSICLGDNNGPSQPVDWHKPLRFCAPTHARSHEEMACTGGFYMPST